jgi:signal transduction histidine kinase
MEKSSNFKRTAAFAFTALLIFSILLFLFYLFDNKYTQGGIQPENGILDLTDQDPSQNFMLFLTKGWAFYPGVLQTPGDFGVADSQAYMQYVTIGEYNDFSQGSPSRPASGTATYRLVLHLPQTPALYAIALPEIYSAYRLYIGDSLAAQAGDPDPGSYEAAVGSRVLEFQGSGTVVLLLDAANYSHFYSGLTYPPLFGSPQNVQQAVALRLVLRAAVLMLLLVTALIFATFALRIKERAAALFSAACLCTIGYSLYPIVFAFWTLPVSPWYSFEIACLYGTYFIAVLLQNRICAIDNRRAHIFAMALLIAVTLIVIYTLPGVTGWLSRSLFQGLTRGVKLAVAAYLLFTSLYAARSGQKAYPLIAGTAAFGIALAADRLLPLYEPIYGGWFPEYGGLFLVLSYGIVLWGDMAAAYRFRLTFDGEIRQLTRQVAIQKAHYLELTEKIDEARRIRHDQRHLMRTLAALADEGDTRKLRDYLRDYESESGAQARTVLCDNLIADAILQYYANLCRQADIRFDAAVELPPQLPIPDTVLSIVMGNLLENACDACAAQRAPAPYVRVTGRYRQDRFMLRVENSYDNPLRSRGERFLSTKHAGEGMGTQSVRHMARDYGGTVSYKGADQVFTASVILNAPPAGVLKGGRTGTK